MRKRLLWILLAVLAVNMGVTIAQAFVIRSQAELINRYAEESRR